MDTIKIDRLCEALLNEIDAVVGVSMRSEEEGRLLSSWRVGQLILKTEQASRLADVERSRLMEQLSAQLKKRYGTRYGVRNVYYMRKFASLYEKPEPNAALSWTHYRLLLQVEDDTVRETLESRAAVEALSYRSLAALVNSAMGIAPASTTQIEKVLRPNDRQKGVYKVVRGASGVVQLDAGFDVAAGDRQAAADGEGGRFCEAGERGVRHGGEEGFAEIRL